MPKNVHSCHDPERAKAVDYGGDDDANTPGVLYSQGLAKIPAASTFLQDY